MFRLATSPLKGLFDKGMWQNLSTEDLIYTVAIKKKKISQPVTYVRITFSRDSCKYENNVMTECCDTTERIKVHLITFVLAAQRFLIFNTDMLLILTEIRFWFKRSSRKKKLKLTATKQKPSTARNGYNCRDVILSYIVCHVIFVYLLSL